MLASLVSIRDASLSFSSLYNPATIFRENLISTIDDLSSEGYNQIVVEGTPGSGKTTLLLQFASQHHSNSFTYFINPSCKLTFSPDYFLEDLGRQLHFALTGDLPEDALTFNEQQFNTLITSLLKKHNSKGQKTYFIIDGLDQIEKSDQNILLPLINNLPFNTNNFFFVLSGDLNNISDLLSNKSKRNLKSFRVTNFSTEEIMKFFGWQADSQFSYARELQSTWKGHPDTMSQIKRILKNGTTIDEFLNNDDIAKEDLLEVEWNQSGIKTLAFEDSLVRTICILAFNDTVRNIHDIEVILNEQDGTLRERLRNFSFLNIRNCEIDFASNSLRRFVQRKLERYKNETLTILVNYFLNKNDTNSLVNLPQILHEKKDYSGIIKLLTFSNLTLILNNSQSFGEISRQLNYGYKASKQLSRAYEDLFRFSLYRSTLLGIQSSDRREYQIEAYVRLGKFHDAERLISNAVLKEDRLKIIIKYLKELKSNSQQDVDTRHLDELKHLLETCDQSFIKQNLVDISVDLALIDPGIAISTVEAITGNSSPKSIEWLLGYIAFLSKNATPNASDSLKIETTSLEEIDNYVDQFSESMGFSVKQCSGYKVIEEVEKAESINDKIFRIKGWIKEHQEDENMFKIIEYALNLIVESSSLIKPSSTTLFEIIQPISFIKSEWQLKMLVASIKELVKTINSPTIDKYRVEFCLIYAIFQYNENEAAERAFDVFSEMQEIKDLGVKLEIQCFSYELIRRICKEIAKQGKFIFSVDEIKEEIERTFQLLLIHTADQYEEVKDVLRHLAKSDINLAIAMSKRLNVEVRRMLAIRQCIVSHTKLPISQWEYKVVDSAMRELIGESILYSTALLSIVDSAFERVSDLANDDKNIFSKIVRLIEPVINESVRCVLITKSIVILSSSVNGVSGTRLTFGKLILPLKAALQKAWNGIQEPLTKTASGYRIAAHLSQIDSDLAEEYLLSTELIGQDINIDNPTHLHAFSDSIKLCIRAFGGIIKKDKNAVYEKIKSLIDQVSSTREQISLWSDLAIKHYSSGMTEIAVDIVQKHILQILEKYRVKNDKEYFYFLLRESAGALQLTHSEALQQYLLSLTDNQVSAIISGVLFVVLTKKEESEPYEGSYVASKVSFQDIINFIRLLNVVNDDHILYMAIHKITTYVREKNTDFSREQKSTFKSKLTELYTNKLPSPKTGIAHDGYLILAQATCSHYDFNIQPSEQIKYFEMLEQQAYGISNVPDRVFTLSWLAAECIHNNSTVKKKQIDLLNKAFDEAAKIETVSERITSYLSLAEQSQKISGSVFKERYEAILADLYKLDEKEQFPTFRNFIDLVYKTDKHLAQKWIDALDNDPARKSIVEPTKGRHEQLEMETKVMEDYSLYGRIKDHSRMANIALKMLGELHTRKRAPRSMDKVVYFLYTASQIPFYYAIPAFSFFIENAIIDDSTNSEVLNSFYNTTCGNADFCYALISSVNNKRINTSYSLLEPEDNLMVKPGMRDEAITFIKKHVKNTGSKNIILIDQYFSEKDVLIIKEIASWSFDAKITILTSLKEAKDLSRQTFIYAWELISADPLPDVKIIKTWTGENKSPFHDRWIVFDDKMKGIQLGTSLNSLGNQISKISFMHSDEENIQVQNDIVIPFVKNRSNIVNGAVIKYETFDI